MTKDTSVSTRWHHRAVGIVLGLVVCLGASLMLVACGGSSADELAVREVVTTTLDAYTGDDVAERVDVLLDEQTRKELADYGIDAGTFVQHCLANLSYEVGDVTVDGETAVASVTLTNADLDEAMSVAESRFEEYADTDEAEETFEDGGEAALMAKLFDYYYEAIESSAELVSTTVEVSCTKDEAGVWTCTPDANPSLMAVIYGKATGD